MASSQPIASMAGAEILRRGGSAADAAVATAAALQVTQPCSTGLGGDCFCLYYEAATGRVYALNGSGRSPAALDLNLLAREGFARELPMYHGHTVTVPGAPAAWCDTVSRFGKLPISDVVAPAIRIAEEGFPVSPMTAIWWAGGAEKQLKHTRHGAELLTDKGNAPAAGEVFRNRNLANSLGMLASEGSAPFYTGRIADRIVDAVAEAGGILSRDDLASHHSVWVDPISIEYRGIRVFECPPNGQGLAALIALGVMRHASIQPEDLPEAARYHLMIEAMRIGFADAGRYAADPEFGDAPIDSLLAESYTRSRFEEISPSRRLPAVLPGQFELPDPGDDTVYLCVVDAEGNGCSFINSNYMGFGTGIVPEGCGYSLQNRGKNFSLDLNHPNRLEPGKRPYHTIIPGLATRTHDGSLYATFGVMGGFMQPQGHLQVVSSLVDDRIDPQAALDRTRFQIAGGAPDGAITLEPDVEPDVVSELRNLGHRITLVSGSARSSFGLGQIIQTTEDGTRWAASDPRGDGVAVPVQ